MRACLHACVHTFIHSFIPPPITKHFCLPIPSPSSSSSTSSTSHTYFCAKNRRPFAWAWLLALHPPRLASFIAAIGCFIRRIDSGQKREQRRQEKQNIAGTRSVSFSLSLSLPPPSTYSTAWLRTTKCYEALPGNFCSRVLHNFFFFYVVVVVSQCCSELRPRFFIYFYLTLELGSFLQWYINTTVYYCSTRGYSNHVGVEEHVRTYVRTWHGPRGPKTNTL